MAKIYIAILRSNVNAESYASKIGLKVILKTSSYLAQKIIFIASSNGLIYPALKKIV